MSDRASKMSYMPMYKVNAAPLVYDRRIFSELGGFNTNFSCVGDSGIDFDFEYSIRCVLKFWAFSRSELFFLQFNLSKAEFICFTVPVTCEYIL